MTSQQRQNICITFVQRRPNVLDVGPKLYKCFGFTGIVGWLLWSFSPTRNYRSGQLLDSPAAGYRSRVEYCQDGSWQLTLLEDDPLSDNLINASNRPRLFMFYFSRSLHNAW